ncbi:MAG: hypothetical protein EU548_08015 [Promethearchaeota archaeon]|nr:MAG: hypothetical protein EU548_08015 [Candidatus Lokiarchaeota archaeon]
MNSSRSRNCIHQNMKRARPHRKNAFPLRRALFPALPLFWFGRAAEARTLCSPSNLRRPDLFPFPTMTAGSVPPRLAGLYPYLDLAMSLRGVLEAWGRV